MNNHQTISTPDKDHYVGSANFEEGTMKLEIPGDVVLHRYRTLYRTLDDLEAIETLGDMLFRAEFDQELAGITRDHNCKAIGWAISALARRVRTSSTGALAEEYDRANAAVEKENKS